MTRLVILDFDGTLADTQPIIIASIQHTLRELHLPSRSDAECSAIIGLPLAQCFVTLCGVDDDTAERCADVYRRVFDELNTDGMVKLFPHVLDTIHTMHNRGLQLALCSSRGRPTLEGFVKSFQLEKYFSMVVSANDVEYHKPHPEPVQMILEALRVDPPRGPYGRRCQLRHTHGPCRRLPHLRRHLRQPVGFSTARRWCRLPHRRFHRAGEYCIISLDYGTGS